MKASNSAIQCFKSCRRMYELKYIYGLEAVQSSDAIKRGLSYHDKVEQVLGNSDHSFIADENLKTNAMARAFQAYILPQLELRQIANVEGWFEYTLPNGHLMRGRYDAVCKNGTVVEHKTVSGLIDGVYLQRLALDEQIPTYLHASGGNFVIYTVCATPSIRQKKNESDEDFETRCFDWYEDGDVNKITVLMLYRDNEQIERFIQEQDAIVDEMDHCKNYYRNPNHCMKWGRLCEYAPVCMDYDPNQEYIQFRRREFDDSARKT